jgi:UDP-N-acetylglucosamine--N-acetylmuramyl-(pentapeptide) pyrophosphoryl-undecaprenol N-acetylglucosamine transferase
MEQRFRVVTLPAVGLTRGRLLYFGIQAWKSFRRARREFHEFPPDVFLSMGGFTGTPAAVAARLSGARIVLHEANAIPGRANRWLRHLAQCGYVFFPEAAGRLRGCKTHVFGMPVRNQFQPGDAGACRMALGLAPNRPVLLVMGGSQGARGINELMMNAIGLLANHLPDLQFLHLSGAEDCERVRDAYRTAGVSAMVRPFLTEMELALGAADAAVARAGASSLAELAAMQVPTLLIPFPHAADNHQLANATALERTEAAWVLPQAEASPQRFCSDLVLLLTDSDVRARLRSGLANWHRPDLDIALAQELLRLASQGNSGGASPCPPGRSAPSASLV